MTHEQYQNLTRITKPQTLLTANKLINQNDRTLLFGRTSDRRQFHVYLKDHQITVLHYKVNWKNNHPTPDNIRNLSIQKNYEYIPDIVYPEKSDYEFCKRLIELGYNLPLKECTDEDFYENGPHNQFDNTNYFGFTIK